MKKEMKEFLMTSGAAVAGIGISKIINDAVFDPDQDVKQAKKEAKKNGKDVTTKADGTTTTTDTDTKDTKDKKEPLSPWIQIGSGCVGIFASFKMRSSGLLGVALQGLAASNVAHGLYNLFTAEEDKKALAAAKDKKDKDKDKDKKDEFKGLSYDPSFDWDTSNAVEISPRLEIDSEEDVSEEASVLMEI